MSFVVENSSFDEFTAQLLRFLQIQKQTQSSSTAVRLSKKARSLSALAL